MASHLPAWVRDSIHEDGTVAVFHTGIPSKDEMTIICGMPITTLKIQPHSYFDRFVRLSELPASLQDLTISRCDLVSLPASLPVTLHEISIYNIRHLDAFDLSHVVRLALHSCHIDCIPDDFFNNASDTLEILNLANNNLRTLPDNIGNIHTLVELVVENNQLETLPSTIGNLHCLRKLRVPINKLQSLPESIGNLRALDYLCVRLNKLMMLPDSIGGMSALTTLYLACNELRALPASFGQLQALRILWLHNNKFTHGPPEVLKQLNITLEKLTLSYNPLGPAGTLIFHWNMPCLQRLELTDTDLGSLSLPRIVRMPQLKHLTMFDNPGIKFLPPAIASMHNLVTIHNEISIPLPSTMHALEHFRFNSVPPPPLVWRYPIHIYFPEEFKRIVETFCLCNNRETAMPRLPREMIIDIFECVVMCKK